VYREGGGGRHAFASFHSKIGEKETEAHNEYDMKTCCWWQGKRFDRQVEGQIPLGHVPEACLETREVHELAVEATRQTMCYPLVY
jgi:hypothetical protein